MADEELGGDNVVILADRTGSGLMWSPEQAMQAAKQFIDTIPDGPTGVLVLVVKSVPKKEYTTSFYNSGMSVLEMAQMCRVMELRFMNMLGAVKTELREAAHELMVEEGLLG